MVLLLTLVTFVQVPTHAMTKQAAMFLGSQWKKRNWFGKACIVYAGAYVLDEFGCKIKEEDDKIKAERLFKEIFPKLSRQYRVLELMDYQACDKISIEIGNMEPHEWSNKKKLLVKYMVDNFNELDVETLKIVAKRCNLRMRADDVTTLDIMRNLPLRLPLGFLQYRWYRLTRRDCREFFVPVDVEYNLSKKLGMPSLQHGLAAVILKNFDQQRPIDQEKLDWAVDMIWNNVRDGEVFTEYRGDYFFQDTFRKHLNYKSIFGPHDPFKNDTAILCLKNLNQELCKAQQK